MMGLEGTPPVACQPAKMEAALLLLSHIPSERVDRAGIGRLSALPTYVLTYGLAGLFPHIRDATLALSARADTPSPALGASLA